MTIIGKVLGITQKKSDQLNEHNGLTPINDVMLLLGECIGGGKEGLGG